MNQHFSKAAGSTLVHNLRNKPTWDQLWMSEDPKDRDACFDGEEGVDFAPQTNALAMLGPQEAAKAAQPFTTAKSQQQQQKVKTVADLEAQYIQQQMQQPQM